MNYAIILSGGTGTRLGLDMPKQYFEVNKKPIIHYVIETMEQCELVDGFVIVAAEEWQEYVRKQISVFEKFVSFALPVDVFSLPSFRPVLTTRILPSSNIVYIAFVCVMPRSNQ